MAPFPRLDTYQSERAPHIREFIELAIRLGGLINTKSVEAGLAAGVRRENEPAKLEVKKPLLGPGLSAANTELTGQLAPKFALADGRRSDDVVGFRYCLLTTVAFAAELTPTLQAVLSGSDVVLLDDDVTALQDWLYDRNVKAVLVRPDRYVLGAVKNDNDLAAILAVLDRNIMPSPLPAAN